MSGMGRRIRWWEDEEGRDFPSCPSSPSRPPASERNDEEENQRDQQYVDDERFDEHQTQNQVATDLARGARVPRDALDGRTEALGLTESAESGGEGQRKTAGDDRPLGDHVPGSLFARRRLLRIHRRGKHHRRYEGYHRKCKKLSTHIAS